MDTPGLSYSLDNLDSDSADELDNLTTDLDGLNAWLLIASLADDNAPSELSSVDIQIKLGLVSLNGSAALTDVERAEPHMAATLARIGSDEENLKRAARRACDALAQATAGTSDEYDYDADYDYDHDEDLYL